MKLASLCEVTNKNTTATHEDPLMISKVEMPSQKDMGAVNSMSVRVSTQFIVLSGISAVLVAFSLGQVASVRMAEILQSTTDVLESGKSYNEAVTGALPDLGINASNTEAAPSSVFSSKYFNATRSTACSRWITTDMGKQHCVRNLDDDDDFWCEMDPSLLQSTEDEDDDEKSEHVPRGEHLLVDIENVNAEFLNSEYRLALAMLKLVDECGLDLLSYHCHGLTPNGVSCAGALLDAQVSFHTWPSAGVITLDLFISGDSSALPIVPLVEKLFAIPEKGSNEEPHMRWANKLRGFPDDGAGGESEVTDFYGFPIGRMTEFKQKVMSSETDFQNIDIYDVLRHQQSLEGYLKSLLNDGSYEATHPQLFAPDRIVFLDGVMQSRRSGDSAYHESLVHPAMFAHSNPKRVAIIGGGEGATLREVLKHKTVDKVVMIDIDAKMVSLSREHLPEWNDCGILEGNGGSCFDDPRLELYSEDAFAWFLDRFSGEDHAVEPFDVIIMDALDPQILIPFVEALYDGSPFLQVLPKALSAHGVLVAQVGEAADRISPAESYSVNKNRAKFLRSLVDLGFVGIRDYHESAHGGFLFPWQFTVAFKDSVSLDNWFDNPAAVEYKIRERTIPNAADGGSSLLYFDGATMTGYHHPHQGSEIVFCHAFPHMASCQDGHGFNPAVPELPLAVLAVNRGNEAGPGLLAKEDIPAMSYIGLADSVQSISMTKNTFKLAIQMRARYAREGALELLPGVWQSRKGRAVMLVDTALDCFLNNGCRNVSAESLSLLGAQFQSSAYDPAAERQPFSRSVLLALRGYPKGEELFQGEVRIAKS